MQSKPPSRVKGDLFGARLLRLAINWKKAFDPQPGIDHKSSVAVYAQEQVHARVCVCVFPL